MSDPKRLLESENADLSRLLSAGKSDMPNDAQLASMAAKLGVASGLGGAGGAGGAGASGAGKATATQLGAKVATTKLLAVKIGAAVLAAGAITITAVATVPRASAPPSLAPSAVAAGPGSASVAASPPASAPPTAPVATTEAPEIPPSPSGRVPAPPRPSAIATASPSAESPEVEVRLVGRARDAVASRPADALAIADDHARRFPKGMLEQEREVIAIEALVKLGRRDEAKARAKRFEARFPESTHARRIGVVLGE